MSTLILLDCKVWWHEEFLPRSPENQSVRWSWLRYRDKTSNLFIIFITKMNRAFEEWNEEVYEIAQGRVSSFINRSGYGLYKMPVVHDLSRRSERMPQRYGFNCRIQYSICVVDMPRWRECLGATVFLVTFSVLHCSELQCYVKYITFYTVNSKHCSFSI